MTRTKYNAQRICACGERFDSRREYARWCELKMLERSGEIRDLKRQVRYKLIPAQRDGKRLLERECAYIADFTYQERAEGGWAPVVEDVKGVRTPEYIIKRKLMLYLHGIRVREV